jgi:hypothetical protein
MRQRKCCRLNSSIAPFAMLHPVLVTKEFLLKDGRRKYLMPAVTEVT